MAGYTRQESYVDGDTILAADSNNEFDAQVTAFNSTGAGHRHDGTSAEGSGVPVLTDADSDTFIKVEETADIDRINFNVAASSDILKMTATEVIFNDDGNDVDFRIESSTNANMFDLDGGVSGIGIGTAAGSTHLLDISGDVIIVGDLTHTGDLAVSGASSFLSVATSSNADIAQNLTVGETLEVAGASSLASAEIVGALTVDGASSFLSVAVSSDADVAQNFSVGEVSTFTGNVGMLGALSVAGNSSFLSVETSSDAVINQNLSVGEQSSFVGSLYASSIVYLQGSAGTAGQVFTSRGTTGEAEWTTGTDNYSTQLSALQDVSVRSTGIADADMLIYTSTGATFYDQTLSGDGTIDNTGALTITQSAGNFVVNGTLQATSATTFLSVATSSDVSVGQNLSVGETLQVTGVSSFTAGVEMADTLTVDGASSFLSIATSSDIDVAQNLTVGETMTVAGASSFLSVEVSSDATIAQNLSVGEISTFTGAVGMLDTLSVAGASSFLSVETSSDLTVDQNATIGETLAVAGASSFSGAVEMTQTLTVDGASSFLSVATSSNADVAQNLTVGETLGVTGNSTFTALVTVGGAVRTIPLTLTSTMNSTGQMAVDFSQSNHFIHTSTQSQTLGNPSNLTTGQSGSIFWVQDGVGSRTLAFASNWEFAAGTAPTLTTTASAVDRIDYVVHSSTGRIHAVATLALS